LVLDLILYSLRTKYIIAIDIIWGIFKLIMIVSWVYYTLSQIKKITCLIWNHIYNGLILWGSYLNSLNRLYRRYLIYETLSSSGGNWKIFIDNVRKINWLVRVLLINIYLVHLLLYLLLLNLIFVLLSCLSIMLFTLLW